jgi:hypothetical protein
VPRFDGTGPRGADYLACAAAPRSQLAWPCRRQQAKLGYTPTAGPPAAQRAVQLVMVTDNVNSMEGR